MQSSSAVSLRLLLILDASQHARSRSKSIREPIVAVLCLSTEDIPYTIQLISTPRQSEQDQYRRDGVVSQHRGLHLTLLEVALWLTTRTRTR